MWILIIVGLIVLALIVARVRSHRTRDGVDSFRRQIDALSPEARRPVIDQVQSAASRIEPRPADAAPDSGDGDGADSDDEGGNDSDGEDDSRGA